MPASGQRPQGLRLDTGTEMFGGFFGRLEPSIHEENAPVRRLGKDGIVRHHNDRPVLLAREIPKDTPQIGPCFRIERARWFDYWPTSLA